MALLSLPRLSNSGPIASNGGAPTIYLVKWWNAVCTAIEGAVNQIATQQAQIDDALGIANGAAASASQISQAVVALGTVGKGGTGQTSLTAHAVIVGEGMAPVASVGPGATNTVLAGAGSSTDPAFETVTALLDAAFGSTQGSILYRNATVWTMLGPGTAGQKLTSGGPAANPSWV